MWWGLGALGGKRACKRPCRAIDSSCGCVPPLRCQDALLADDADFVMYKAKIEPCAKVRKERTARHRSVSWACNEQCGPETRPSGTKW